MSAQDSAQLVMVAHVTVADDMMTVKVDEIHVAIAALSGALRPGALIETTIRFDAMTHEQFAALPEYQ